MIQRPSGMLGSLFGHYYEHSDWNNIDQESRFRAASRNERFQHRLFELARAGNIPLIFTYTITWRDLDGTTHGVMVDACTRSRAKFTALKLAIKDGYTRPKWWAFWRWNEKNLDFDSCWTNLYVKLAIGSDRE